MQTQPTTFIPVALLTKPVTCSCDDAKLLAAEAEKKDVASRSLSKDVAICQMMPLAQALMAPLRVTKSGDKRNGEVSKFAKSLN